MSQDCSMLSTYCDLEARQIDTADRQLLVDISNIAKRDARTGIQRVVRAIASALQHLSPPDLRIRLIAADRQTAFRYLPDDWLQHQTPGRELRLADYPLVEALRGDIFLGLDFCTSILCAHEARLAEWREQGVRLNFFLYDLLPQTHGRWFTFKMRRNYRRWLKLIERRADHVVAISNSVASQFSARRRTGRGCSAAKVTIARLGSNISASLPSRGLPANSAAVLAWIAEHPTVLMVGTIEPRKGYDQALKAFETLWRREPNAPQLLIIGRPGWKTEKLQRLMRERSGNAKFLWLEHATDEFLEEIYARASGLLVASEGEGFGLPIVEGLSHGLPVLARDLPVFRELEGLGLNFFRANAPGELAVAVDTWCKPTGSGVLKVVRGTASWEDAAQELLGLIVPQDSSHQLRQSAVVGTPLSMWQSREGASFRQAGASHASGSRA